MEQGWLILLLGIVTSELMLTHLVGVCPFLAVSKQFETALGMALAVVLVQPVATGLYLLLQGNLAPAFAVTEIALPLIVLCNVTAVYGFTIVVQRVNHDVLTLSRPFMSILNVNCVLLGVTLLTLDVDGTLLNAIVLAAGYGFGLIVVAEIRERLALTKTPTCMQGAPIILLTLGIISLAISGIRG